MTLSSHTHHAEERDSDYQVPPIYASLPMYVRQVTLGVVMDVRGDSPAVRISPTLIVSFDPDQSSWFLVYLDLNVICYVSCELLIIFAVKS